LTSTTWRRHHTVHVRACLCFAPPLLSPSQDCDRRPASGPRTVPLASPLAGLPCPILRRLSNPRVAALGHPSPGPGALRWGCGAALGTRAEPWAGRVRQRVVLGVGCRSSGAKMPCVFPSSPRRQVNRAVGAMGCIRAPLRSWHGENRPVGIYCQPYYAAEEVHAHRAEGLHALPMPSLKF